MNNHDQSPEPDARNYNKAFAFGIILNVVYIIVEVAYGLIVDSIALIADAGHNFSDVLGLVLAWGASLLAQKAATKTKTYGMRKATILAALFNAIILFIAVGAITIEAIRKIFQTEAVSGSTIIFVAGVGVIINTVTALLFLKGRKTDINIKGAFLHMAADAGVSLGVVAAGLLIYFTSWYLVDPIISLVIVVVIIIGTWGLLRDSFFMSLDAVPKNIDFAGVEQYLQSLEGVTDVHDLHIWPMSTTETALTVHLGITKNVDTDRLIGSIADKMQKDFDIVHVTVQTELEHGDECKQKSDSAI